jgi:hypothetical protein
MLQRNNCCPKLLCQHLVGSINQRCSQGDQCTTLESAFFSMHIWDSKSTHFCLQEIPFQSWPKNFKQTRESFIVLQRPFIVTSSIKKVLMVRPYPSCKSVSLLCTFF